MVADMRVTCDCCGKRESGCLIGVVNCRCETAEAKFFIPTVPLCPNCKRCSVHCICSSCSCGDIKIFGHDKNCAVRIGCRERIAQEDKEFSEFTDTLREFLNEEGK